MDYTTHSAPPSNYEELIQKATGWVQSADRVIVAGGAGISVDAGNDYTDKKAFAERFPAMARRGYKMPYEFIGKTDWEPKLQWGYLLAHVDLVRFKLPKHQVYTDLLNIISKKDYFVITSNVDGMFERNGFDKERIWTPQGDFERMQCLRTCTPKSYWPVQPILEKVLPSVDPQTQEITKEELIPKCIHCGGPVAMNVRGGAWFIEEPYKIQEAKFGQWVNSAIQNKQSIVILEFGAGFNTPGVIRGRMESLTYRYPLAKLVRVNMQYEFVPDEIEERAIGIKGGALQTVIALKKRFDTTENSSS